MFKSLKIIFAGTPDFAAHHLDALVSYGYNIVGVFTQPDRPAGRGKKIKKSPVKILAEKKKIPVFQPISLYLNEIKNLIKNLNADVMVVVAYGLVLPNEILHMPRFGCINVHGSLLPRWRGAAPIQRSILAGDTETGITIIQMDVSIDTGKILYKLSCPINNKDTSHTLYDKLSKLGQKGLLEILQRLVHGDRIEFEIQNESLATYAKKINKDEAFINWYFPATKLERCIRAFNPWPTSWMQVKEHRIKIWRASVIKMPSTNNIQPGTIFKVDSKGIQIATVKDLINIELLQFSGKKPTSVKKIIHFLNKWLIPGMNLLS